MFSVGKDLPRAVVEEGLSVAIVGEGPPVAVVSRVLPDVVDTDPAAVAVGAIVVVVGTEISASFSKDSERSSETADASLVGGRN